MKILTRRFSSAVPLLCCFLLFVGRAARSESVEQLPPPTDYVNDFANVLSSQSVIELDRICAELNHSSANSQLIIVTVRNLDGMEAADYASQLEERWRIGRRGSDRGILLLLAADDRKWRIDVGYGLEGILTDAKVGDIGRSMVPFLRAKAYDSAVKVAVIQLSQVIAADAKTTLSQALPPQRIPPPPLLIAVVPVAFLIVFLIVFFGIFAFLLFRRGAIGSVGNDSDTSSGSTSSSGSNSGGGFDASNGGSFGGGGAGGSW
jgi:uncharacterized protein